MNRSIKNLLTGLRIAFGLGLLYYVLSTTGGWSAATRLMSIVWLLPGMGALTLFGAAIESIRLGLLFKSQGMRLSFGEGYRLVAIGTFFNFCIPGGTGGDIMKLYCLASENRKQVVEIATVLLVDRAVALFSLLTLVVGLALLNGPLIKDYALIRWLIIASVVGMIGLFVMAVISCSSRIRSSGLYRCLIINVPFHRYLERASNALYAFRHHKTALVGAALSSMIGHLALAGMFLASGLVLLSGVPSPITCLLALLGMLANALPITPGGLGVGETAFDGLFRLVGYAGGAQLLLAWRIGMLPICFFGCILYLCNVRRGCSLTEYVSEATTRTHSSTENVGESLSQEKTKCTEAAAC